MPITLFDAWMAPVRAIWRRGLFEPASLATAGLLIVLIGLPTFVFVGAETSFDAGQAARHASQINGAYEQARYSVGAEESLNRKYRLQPAVRVRQAHKREAELLVAALQKIRIMEPDSAESIDSLLAMHAAYLEAIDRMFIAVDANKAAKANAIDEAEVNPIFNELQRRIYAAADKHRILAVGQLDRLERIQRAVFFATPVAFATGLLLVVFFVVILRRYRRQTIEATAAANRQNELRFRSLVQHLSNVILVCDTEGKVIYEAPTAGSGLSAIGATLSGTILVDLVHPDDQAELQVIWRRIRSAAGESGLVELRLRNDNGRWHHTECALTNLLHETSVSGIVATMRDVTERKNFEAQLTTQAFYDSLTGLPNRALLRDRIDQSVVRAGRDRGKISLLFIDLDDFKRINDSLGHREGDMLLIAAARRLKECVGPSDTVARLGGDEFVILLDQLNNESINEAKLVAETVLKQFEMPWTLDGREYVVTASVGMVLADSDMDSAAKTIDADALLRDADVAMYRAKSTGKSRYVVFDASMHDAAVDRLAVETDLRQAIQRNELRVHFQPVVHLRTGQVREMEALVRWQHPIRGMVSPSDFIPVAEETGLIIPIGRSVLTRACEQVASWQAQFPLERPLQVSVNLSPRQFEDPALVDDVTCALRHSGARPGSLKLEVTEGVVMRDTEASIQTLHKLKAQGIQIAIDDFGTGYSSLSYLKKLPLDVLKIDRSFVQGIGSNPEDDAIVQAIISLAQSLGLGVTAEGIETEEQAKLLRAWSCESGQGFLFAPPLQADSATELLHASEGAATTSLTARPSGNGRTTAMEDSCDTQNICL